MKYFTLSQALQGGTTDSQLSVHSTLSCHQDITETGRSPEMPDRPNRGDAAHTLKRFFF